MKFPEKLINDFHELINSTIPLMNNVTELRTHLFEDNKVTNILKEFSLETIPNAEENFKEVILQFINSVHDDNDHKNVETIARTTKLEDAVYGFLLSCFNIFFTHSNLLHLFLE
jgi:hypothetical protein